MTEQPLTTFDPDIDQSTAGARPYVVDVKTIYDTDDYLSMRDRELIWRTLDLHARDLAGLGEHRAVLELRELANRIMRPGCDVLIVESEGQA